MHFRRPAAPMKHGAPRGRHHGEQERLGGDEGGGGGPEAARDTARGQGGIGAQDPGADVRVREERRREGPRGHNCGRRGRRAPARDDRVADPPPRDRGADTHEELGRTRLPPLHSPDAVRGPRGHRGGRGGQERRAARRQDTRVEAPRD